MAIRTNFEHKEEITKLKEWTKKNFIFNNQLVYYSTYANVPTIEPLPMEFMYEGFSNKKADFDTPLSHLMSVLISIGMAKQQRLSEEAIEYLVKNPYAEVVN